jgi:hypothetical protein
MTSVHLFIAAALVFNENPAAVAVERPSVAPMRMVQ